MKTSRASWKVLKAFETWIVPLVCPQVTKNVIEYIVSAWKRVYLMLDMTVLLYDFDAPVDLLTVTILQIYV